MLRPPSLLGRVASVIQRMQHPYTVKDKSLHDQSFVTPVGACKLLDAIPSESSSETYAGLKPYFGLTICTQASEEAPACVV